jgi:hypothetical protein
MQAEIHMAILGIDFLRTNSLSVDPAGGKLVQTGIGLALSTITSISGATALTIRSELATIHESVPVTEGKAVHLLSTAVSVRCKQVAPSSPSSPLLQ